MARAADTNVIVRLIVRDDAKQVAQATAYASAGLWVSQVVLAEVAWVLASVYELAANDVARAIEMMLDHADLTVEAPDMVRAALARLRTEKGVDFADCLIVEIARKAGQTPVVTFNRALAKLDGAELIR
jgi:predicted nucleic-acid-binding protein